MATVGQACLILALAMCVYGIVASLYGATAGRREWVDSGRRAVYGLAFLATTAFVILEVAFLRSDFHYTVVASHSSTTTPTFYKAAAMWSSQEGSLLLWVWLLSVWSSLVLFMVRRRLRDVAPYATAVLLVLGAFFTSLLAFAASPFETVASAPAEGMGLNALLRHPSMMIHPPMLYSGYTLWAVPFAFAIGALVVRRVDADWIRATRRFALAAWFFLGIGILLGARWSYSELGWGGYWAWDPVENASLLPWLTGTAFLHSVMVQEKRGMLKIWNVSLILTTGVLAILGTFLVRSGILDSIHAFGASTLGIPFVTLIGLMIVVATYLVVSRRGILRSEHRLDSLLSREAAFLGNNIVLVGLAFVVFWGTFFPLISEAITGTKAAVGPPWFNRYTVPLALVLVLLSGIGPVIAWRRATLANVRRNFVWPCVAALATLALVVAVGAAGRPLAVTMFVVAAFTVGVLAQELWRGVSARRAMASEGPARALVSLVRRNRRRYGGYTVHLGMAVLFVGVAASSAFQHARDVRLTPGQSAKVGGYDVKYVKPTARVDYRDGNLERIALGARLEVRKDGRRVARLHTERAYYPAAAPFASGSLVQGLFEGEATSEVGLKAGALHDIWTVIQPDPEYLNKVIDGVAARTAGKPIAQQQTAVSGLLGVYQRGIFPAQFRLLVSPLVTWIWVGGIIVFIGGLIALWPAPDAARRRVTAGYAARVARELGRA
ncbi:MAG: cytochrome c-type biosis protein CcmF [Solirubrobacteraceae bacterium]|nr:cytochrome c-type biosis protein CcmF [Solirubrobacteraceae bacterium]MEA2359675.1 cytochrome c-type biosis protein CcmF [Solirubrobacteraceae bacterium]